MNGKDGDDTSNDDGINDNGRYIKTMIKPTTAIVITSAHTLKISRDLFVMFHKRKQKKNISKPEEIDFPPKWRITNR